VAICGNVSRLLPVDSVNKDELLNEKQQRGYYKTNPEACFKIENKFNFEFCCSVFI
jgi:hypothetical protein